MTNVLHEGLPSEHHTSSNEGISYEDAALGDMADVLDRTVFTFPEEVTRAFTDRDPEAIADLIMNNENPAIRRNLGGAVVSILGAHRP